MEGRKKRREHVSAAGKPVLIVCPTSVRGSWEKHLAVWGHFESRSIETSTTNTRRTSLQARQAQGCEYGTAD